MGLIIIGVGKGVGVGVKGIIVGIIIGVDVGIIIGVGGIGELNAVGDANGVGKATSVPVGVLEIWVGLVVVVTLTVGVIVELGSLVSDPEFLWAITMTAIRIGIIASRTLSPLLVFIICFQVT